jgi:hypothetical protein
MNRARRAVAYTTAFFDVRIKSVFFVSDCHHAIVELHLLPVILTFLLPAILL